MVLFQISSVRHLIDLGTRKKPSNFLLQHHLFILFLDIRRCHCRINLCCRQHLLDPQNIQWRHSRRQHHNHIVLHGLLHCIKYRHRHQSIRYHCTCLSRTLHGCIWKNTHHHLSLKLRLRFLVLLSILCLDHHLHHCWHHCRHQSAFNCQFHYYCWHVQTHWPLFLHDFGSVLSHCNIHEDPTETWLRPQLEISLRSHIWWAQRGNWHVIRPHCLQRQLV